MQTLTEHLFVVDLTEFNTSMKLWHRFSPCLTRPLYHYNGLALASCQGVLCDPQAMTDLVDSTRRWAVDMLVGDILPLVVKSKHIHREEHHDVCTYICELIYYLCTAILTHLPSLRQQAGVYDVTIKPRLDLPGTADCLRFSLSLVPKHHHYPAPKLSKPHAHDTSTDTLRDRGEPRTW